MEYGQSFTENSIEWAGVINLFGKKEEVKLRFEPFQAIALTIKRKGRMIFNEIRYDPPIPKIKGSKDG